jgi:hypothetical protein
MRRDILKAALLPAIVGLAICVPGGQANHAFAADAPPATAQIPPEQLDRDGKRIVGYELMTESERAGYRSTLFFMKTLPERDAFRAQHLESMKKRAKEKGVTLQQ